MSGFGARFGVEATLDAADRWAWQADEVFERFDSAAKQAIVTAQAIARERGARQIDTDHVLAAALAADAPAVDEVLKGLGTSRRELFDAVVDAAPGADGSMATVGAPAPFTRAAKACLDRSQPTAVALGNRHIGAEHLLLAILEGPSTPGTSVLAAAGVTHDGVLEQLGDGPAFSVRTTRGLGRFGRKGA